MKNTFRKLSTVLLALVMIFAMSISTFAASGSGTNLGSDGSINPDKSGIISNGGVRENGTDSGETAGGKHTHGTFTAVGNTITLDKEIVIFNTRSSDTVVYLPNIKYEYAVEAVDVTNDTGSEKYITDEYGNKGAINDGVAAAINNSDTPYVEFSNDSGISGTGMTAVTTPYVTTTKDGIAAEGHFNLTFNPSNFTKPGVYRYKVTESVASGYGKAMAGIIDNGTYNAERYLDVYVQNNAAGTGYEIYGYVCFEDTSKDKEFEANPGTPITAKTNGFVSEKNDTIKDKYSKTEEGVDIYETSNVKIMKTITGAMADKSHLFPFEATFANSTITKNPKICWVKVETGTEDTTSNSNPTTMTNGTGVVGAASASGTLKLKDGEFIYVYGVPGKEAANSKGTTTVLTKEYNDTAEEYTVSAKYDTAEDDDTLNDIDVKAATTGKAVQMAAGATAEFNAAQTLHIAKVQNIAEVTNKLNAISPTNVVMRFAPYLFILGGAVLLLFASRRRKAEQE